MAQALVFRLGQESYGLDIRFVQEVAEFTEFHFIPRVPDFFLGAINFHGAALPVLDLARYLGFACGHRDARIITLVHEACAMALAVSEVQRIIEIDPDVLMPCPEEKKGARFISGVFGRDAILVNLLNLNELLKDLENQLAATGGGHGA